MLVGNFRFATKIVSEIHSWVSIASDWHPYRGGTRSIVWNLVGDLVEGMIKKGLLRKKFSSHHGFGRPCETWSSHEQNLYRGAWNVDVWL